MNAFFIHKTDQNVNTITGEIMYIKTQEIESILKDKNKIDSIINKNKINEYFESLDSFILAVSILPHKNMNKTKLMIYNFIYLINNIDSVFKKESKFIKEICKPNYRIDYNIKKYLTKLRYSNILLIDK